ncbi:MAG: DegT/DnrJ/EryC1/StrS family aminotransferase [Oligoflexales bacterium]|nr:DegT/DnrJ/EryC1/StrS family aminotransferase [Oligoflexales bacterium]
MIALHEPVFDESDEAYVLRALRDGWVSTGGPFVSMFEEAFAKYVGARYAVSVCNGTIGLHLSLEILKRRHGVSGDFYVIVPTLSFIATANAVVHSGGIPIFIDCDEDSINISPSKIEETLSRDFTVMKSALPLSRKNGKPLLAVMPAHIMGWTTDMNRVASICRSWSLPIIEDAAEALGSFYDGKIHVGRHGAASIFSFNGNKILTTGAGGMIVTNDEEFARKAKHLGTTAKVDTLRFIHDEVGYNYRLANLLAGLGLSQLEKLEQRLCQKRAISEKYREGFSDTSSLTVYSDRHNISNQWLTNIVCAHYELKEKILKTLIEGGVGARPLWAPFHRQPAYSGIEGILGEYPNADRFWERTISLPSSAHLTDGEIFRIVGLVKSVV